MNGSKLAEECSPMDGMRVIMILREIAHRVGSYIEVCRYGNVKILFRFPHTDIKSSTHADSFDQEVVVDPNVL